MKTWLFGSVNHLEVKKHLCVCVLAVPIYIVTVVQFFCLPSTAPIYLKHQVRTGDFWSLDCPWKLLERLVMVFCGVDVGIFLYRNTSLVLSSNISDWSYVYYIFVIHLLSKTEL